MRGLKYLLLQTVFVLLMLNSTNGQSNGSFEEWDGNTPLDWLTNNYDNNIFISPSEDAYSGNYALRLEAKNVDGWLGFGMIESGNEAQGFPVSQKYLTMDFYYKFTRKTDKSYMYVAATMFMGEQEIGLGWKNIYTASDEYVQMTIPITYTVDGVPDRAMIVLWVGDYGQDTTADGTYALVDELSFGSPTTGIEDEINNPNAFNLEQNFPNPFNPSTKIKYTIPFSGENVTLKVYNVLGNEVATLVNETKAAGTYTADFSTSSLASGTYFYKLKAGNFSETKKMILLR